MAHQRFHRLLAGFEGRAIWVGSEDPGLHTQRDQGRGETLTPLHGAEVPGCAVLHESNAPIALTMQVTRGGDAHFVVGKPDLQRCAFGHVVPGFYHRDIHVGDHLFSRRAVEAAGQYQRRRRPAKERTHCALFLLGAEVTGRQQQLIAMPAEGVAEALEGIGKDRPRDVRDHHRHDAPTRRGQPAGHQVGHITQLGHHLGDALAALGRHLLRLVEVTRHGNCRHAGLAGHGVQGDTPGATAFARFVFAHGMILLKTKKNIGLIFQYLTF